jgi:phosphatidylglycerol---prolipoprotein diacylglyceryl transferase
MNSTLGVLFNMIGFGVGATVYVLEARRRGMNMSRTREVALVGVLAGVLIATLVQWGYAYFVGGPGWMANGGKTILGGVIGGWGAVELWKRKIGIKESTGVLWAMALPAGEIFGRIGCWFHGCCGGRETSVPWAVFRDGAWRHPTQIYLSVAALVTFLVVWRLRDRPDVFLISIFMWALGRLMIEPWRESSLATPWVVPAVCAAVAVFVGAKLVRSWRIKEELTA